MNVSDIRSAYLAAPDLLPLLEQEVEGIIGRHDRLILSGKPAPEVYWAQNVWRNPQVFRIDSINHAAKTLKNIQRNWVNFAATLHRRSALIQEKLPHVSAKPLGFPAALPKAPLGSWTLLDAHTLLASPDCASPFAHGEVQFVEDKSGPPNRAYLKLWEALTLLETCPQPGEFCLDAGGAPGGWAWAAAQLGARVLSVDRSELDPALMNLDHVTFQKGDAFNLRPEDFDTVHWLLWDVVCYPEKLYDWLREWVGSGKIKNGVVTIKFQGKPDYGIAKKFAEIGNSRVQHLFHNKHELTWMWQEPTKSE